MIKEKRWTKEKELELISKIDFERYNFKKSDKVYSIDTPPPYINAPIHIGHASVYSMMDMFARYKRMNGYSVIFPLGLDRNGLPIEVAAEKRFKKDLTKLPREDAIALCKKILEETSDKSINSFKRLAISFSSYKIKDEIGFAYLTDSPDYRALTQATFIELWNKGLIYEDERINNWDPKLKTTIADSEIEYKEKESYFNTIIFKCKETKEDLLIGTTRPELLASCGAVIFNPEDKRYKHLEGKTAITPIYNKEVPIIADPLAKEEKGTGLVMMCSAGDLSDIRFFRERNLKAVISIDADGRMNKNAGFLEGLKVKEARSRIIEELKKRKLLIDQKKVMHRTPISERSKAEIEFIAMKEFYLKQIDFKKEIKKIIEKNRFFPNESKKILISWIDSINIDWPISRRRFYGTEIPLWYCKNCSYTYVPKKGRYYQPWKEKPDIEECPKCKGKEFIGESRILDTWFDSASTPLYILGYHKDKELFNKLMPCSLRPQGKEIIRTWLYYTLLKSYLLLNENIFKDIWIHQHILDAKGIKMSKSLGNVISPNEIFEKYGSEAFRLWLVLEGNIANTDLKCSFDKIDAAAKSNIKLWNVAKFISSFDYVEANCLKETDKSIIAELDKIIDLCKISFDNYDFSKAARAIKHFLWEDFASHYLEIAKKRIYNNKERESAIYTLYYVLERILLLLHPIVPLITEELYGKLYKKEIYKESFPKKSSIKSKINFKEIIEANNKIWKYKQENGIKLKESIKESPIKLKEEYKEDLELLHNIGA